jgi:diguanylate cyclase (GGDEF)-like protein
VSKSTDAAKAPAFPLPVLRNGRRGSPAHRDSLLAFRLGVAAPALLVYVLFCVLVLVTLGLMTSEINKVDGDRSRKAIAAAVNSFVLQLGELAADESAWTEAYLNTYIVHNAAWLDSTWGASARAGGHYDAAIVTNADGTILFGESVRGPLSGNIADHFGGADAILTGLDAAITEVGDNASVAHLAQGGGHDAVSAIAAAVIRGATGRLAIPADNRRVLWLARQVDDQMLGKIARLFQVPVPRLLGQRQPAPAEAVLQIADVMGRPVGELVWLPLRPGDAAFINATSVASMVLLVVGILIFAMLTAFRRSVERRAEADERDWVSARYDPTTGLPNRFGLEESIAKLTPRRSDGLNVAIAYIEFEGLKDIAGSYGQETAEKLLDRIADLIDAGIDHQAQLARIGPDEFALWRSGPDAGQLVRRFARTVIELVAEAIPLDDLRLKLAASIGVAETKVTKASVGTPLLLAAAALQHARETGGNHIVEHDPTLDESRQKRLAMQADIRRGLDVGEFDLVYQPIFDFGSQSMLGVEALLRWPHRVGGAMSPGEFIPAAEASGLIEELGLFALRRACQDIAEFRGLKLSVNVSTVQFRSPTLSQKIDSILAATGFPPERLQLEITESFLLAQPDRAKAAIEALRSRGIVIALDDFGTGFSSVGYLRQFSFDRVKLDRSLVEEIDLDPVKMALVESTMVFAFAMGLAVTAEGVERREEAATLTRLGCREYQGFLFSRPLTRDALARLILETPQQLKKAG